MALKSQLFAGDAKLEAAATSHPAHIVPGARGPHVKKIQGALITLDEAKIATPELAAALYGTTTANAVLAYKKKRSVINKNYQSSADNIVGIMTMKSMDDELVALEIDVRPEPRAGRICTRTVGFPEPPKMTAQAFVAGAPIDPFARRTV
jgi:hypothetical protein